MHYNCKNRTPEDCISFIKSKISIDIETGCWNWTGHKNAQGYGKMRFFGGRTGVHRVSFWVFIDRSFEVLENKKQFICHHCDNPSCCNPEHLFLGDIIANQTDYFVKKNGKLKSSQEFLEHKRWRRKRNLEIQRQDSIARLEYLSRTTKTILKLKFQDAKNANQ